MQSDQEISGDEEMASLQRRTLWRLSMLAPLAVAPLCLAAAFVLGASAPFVTLTGCVLFPLLAVAVYTDLRWRIIPNFATYSALLWALGINTIATVASLTGSPELAEKLRTYLGAIGIGSSFLGAVACFTVMYAFYSTRGFGGGDIKIAAAIGALLGWQLGMSVIFWCAVAAAVFGIGSIIKQMGPVTLFCDLVRRMACQLFPGYVTPPQDRLVQLMHTPTPMALFFLIGTTISLLGYTVL